MRDCKVCSNVRGGELHENLLPSRTWSISKAVGFINTIYSLPVVDVGEKESWKDFRREEESNMDAILEGEEEEGMGSNLASTYVLDSVR